MTAQLRRQRSAERGPSAQQHRSRLEKLCEEDGHGAEVARL